MPSISESPVATSQSRATNGQVFGQVISDKGIVGEHHPWPQEHTEAQDAGGAGMVRTITAQSHADMMSDPLWAGALQEYSALAELDFFLTPQGLDPNEWYGQ